MTCKTCEELNKKLKGHRINSSEYRRLMIQHNSDELRKLQEKELQEKERITSNAISTSYRQ